MLVDQNGQKARKRLEEILKKYRVWFKGSVGSVASEEFVVHADIDMAKSDRSPKAAVINYGKNLHESIQQGIEESLNDKAAEGIIQSLARGMIPKSMVSYFGVGKKSPTSAKVELTAQNLRIVAYCNRNDINEKTAHLARQTDSIHSRLQLAAQIRDHSQMFHCYSIAPSLWEYFCILHPKMGILSYRRLPMGWVSSPLLAREMITKIMYDHLSYTSINLDDFFTVVFHFYAVFWMARF